MIQRAAALVCCQLVWLAATSDSTAHAAESRVQMWGGVPTLFVDGQPHSGFCYASYDMSADNLERRAAAFAEAGCDIYNFVVEISGYGYSRPLWVGPDRWDFTDLDNRARRILAVAPHARLLPRIYIDAPAWWCQAHPSELMRLDDGSTSFSEKPFALPRAADFASLASPVWRADMQAALRTIIDHVAASDYGSHVIGYQLSGQKTEEWYHWSMNCERLGDYSEPMQRAFRQWLTDKYGTDSQLQTAWHQPTITLQNASIPDYAARIGDRSRLFRDPLTEQPVVDFHTFWSDVMAETIELFAATVKEHTHGTKIVGAFYAYTFEFAELGEDAGHLGLAHMLRSPHTDFIMAPPSYFNRNLPGKPFFRLPVQSLALHGKLFWNDFDQVSFKYFDKLKADPNLKTWEYQMGLTRTPEEFVWMCRREIGMSLAAGVQTAHFDIHGGYYDDPEIMAGVKQLGSIRRDALSTERDSVAEILVLVDERSPHYVRFRNPAHLPGSFLRDLLSAQVAELGFVAPFDSALLSDLAALDVSRYKLVIVLNAFYLESAQRQLIDQKLKADNRTIVWLYAPGYFDESQNGLERVRDVTEIEIAAAPADTNSTVAWRADDAPIATTPLLAADPLIVTDQQVEVLATRGDAPQQTVAARRPCGDWTSIYSATAPIPAAVLKRIAATAGVHLYDPDPTHMIFANRHYLTVCGSDEATSADLSLRNAADVVDLFTGETMGTATHSFVVPLRPKEVRMFRLEQR